jgi:hypothetical membrane protein
MKSTMKRHTLVYLPLTGVAGPVQSTILIVICSTLRSDYNHVDQFISDLGATGTSHAGLMNFAGFIPSGVIMAAFGMALWTLLPKHLLGRIGASLIILFAVGLIIAGIFSCDPGCPQQGGSMENSIHDAIAGPTFLSAITGMLIFGISFRRFAVWKGLSNYSLISALLCYGFFVLLISSLESRNLTGLWQRLILLTIFFWCGIVGIKLFNFVRSSAPQH